MVEMISESQPVARRQHRCEECGHAIPVGTRYLKQFCKDGGETWTWISHTDCFEMAVRLHSDDGCSFDEPLPILAEYENNTGEFPDWLRGEYPHVVCRLEFWKQKRELIDG